MNRQNYAGKIQTKPPKWATKEYKPVFRMPSEQHANYSNENDQSLPNVPINQHGP